MKGNIDEDRGKGICQLWTRKRVRYLYHIVDASNGGSGVGSCKRKKNESFQGIVPNICTKFTQSFAYAV